MRQDRLVDWIDRNEPDVLCLQETKVQDDLFPVEPFTARGYQVAIHGQKTYNGVAIASRLPLGNVVRGLPASEGGAEEARLISADVAGMRVICAYFPNGQAPGTPKYDGKLAWMARLRAHLADVCAPAARVALVGDFNVAPEDRDVHDPVAWHEQIHCSTAERQALRDIVAIGLVDGLRHLRADAGLYTWWDYRQLAFPRNHGLRIDHVLITPPLVACLRDVSIDRDARKGKQPSDHVPVTATFDLES